MVFITTSILGVAGDGKPRSFSPDDLEAIEKRMRQIVAGKHEFNYREISLDEARELFKNQPYKLELVEGLIEGGTDEYGSEVNEASALSTYRQDTFEDLCRGPHVIDTSQIRPDAFKLLSVAGAYWRGDENNAMLQRIYGTAWNTKSELKQHLQMLEEAKKRDHRKLGKDLEIFIFDEDVGPGLPLWLPNGGIVIEELEKLAKEMEDKRGYDRVRDTSSCQRCAFSTHWASGTLYRQYVSPDGNGRCALLYEANELPFPS